MKKSLWGYDIDQADETIRTLQSQNDMLTTKIAKMTIRLAELEKAVEARDKQALPEQDQNLIAKNEELKRTVEQLEQQNKRLTERVNQLEASASSDYSGERLGDLFARAYGNIENMQRDMSDQMRDSVRIFANLVAEYNDKMKESLGGVQQQYNDMMVQLAERLDNILEGFSVIEDASNKIQEALISPDDIVKEFQQKIDKVILEGQLDPVPESEGAMDPIEETQPISTAEKIKERYFKKPNLEKILVIHADVAKNDVFKSETKEVG